MSCSPHKSIKITAENPLSQIYHRDLLKIRIEGCRITVRCKRRDLRQRLRVLRL